MEARVARKPRETKMQEKETLDERLPGLFEPDTLLPVQYFEAMRRKHLLEGEKRLVLSVLEDAVECFMKCIDSPTSKGQRLFRDAEEWINHEDKHWVFSFDNICDMLDINPDYMRHGLKAWRERRVEAIRQLKTIEQPEDAVAPSSAPALGAKPSPKPQAQQQAKSFPAARPNLHKGPTAERERAAKRGREKVRA